MIRRIKLIFLVGMLIATYSCQKNLEDQEKYKRPSWLAGKVFTQISSEDSLKIFTQCIKRIGFDSVLNTSGCYTVFAPNDRAFSEFFSKHPNYNNSVNDIPYDTLVRIVKSHIINDPWSVEQLRQLDVGGWIDTLALTNNKPRGFKRATLLREPNQKFGLVGNLDGTEHVVDSSQAAFTFIRYTDASKYASIFYKQYFDINKLSASDYQYYFNRPFLSSAMYYMGGQIVKSNVFAENGFIHVIDKVNEPLQSAYDILKSEKSYSKFLDLINMCATISPNLTATNNQYNKTHNLPYDTLYDVYYNTSFSIMDELTAGSAGTVRYHYGLVAPTNDAMDKLLNTILVGPGKWSTLQEAPYFIRSFIVNAHMSYSEPIYPSLLTGKGFLDGDGFYSKFDLNTVVEKKYASNCTFLGVNEAIMPRVFKSVTSPLFLYRNYEADLYSLSLARLFSLLCQQDQHYSFFVENSVNSSRDSSLIVTLDKVTRMRSFNGYNRAKAPGASGKANQFTYLAPMFRNLFYNHIGTWVPSFKAQKEFIRNVAGNYIVIDRTTNPWTVRGSSGTSLQGINGKRDTINIATQISESMVENGVTYDIPAWLNFSSIASMASIIQNNPELSKFKSLLINAKLLDSNGKFTFMIENDFYTVFAPTNTALGTTYDNLSIQDLTQFLLLHFVHGDIIFTDGNKNSGYYETARKDSKSTDYTTIYTKLFIDTSVPDQITIPLSSGAPSTATPVVITLGNSNNIITGSMITSATESSPIPTIYSTGVIHEIDTPLVYGTVDTN